MNAAKAETMERWTQEASVPWLVDSIVTMALGRPEIERLARKSISDGNYCNQPHDEVTRIVFDTRNGRRTIGTPGMSIAEDIQYISHHEGNGICRDAGDEETPNRQHLNPTISVAGRNLPEGVLLSLAGRRVSDVIDHPWLDLPGLTIARAERMLSGGKVKGFFLEVEPVYDLIG